MTIFDIAEKLKVSPSTVSRALNPTTNHLISEPLRKRIQQYASKIGYIPNRTAQELVRGQTHTIGVILSTSFNSVFFSDHLAKILAGIYTVLEDHARYTCKLVVLPRGKPLSETDQHVLGSGVDGLLVSTLSDFSSYTVQDLLNVLQKRWNRPIVALNLEPGHSKTLSTVSFSNRKASYQAVAHLIQKGHRRIGLIFADNGSLDALERMDGYKDALEDHRLPFKSALVAQGDFTVQSGYQAAIRLFGQKSASMTALFCTNDEMAIGALRALKVLRKRCPQDVSVMGFDGLAMDDFMDPRLSTVTQPSQEIAKAGTQLLLDLIEGRQKGPVHMTIPCELILRESA